MWNAPGATNVVGVITRRAVGRRIAVVVEGILVQSAQEASDVRIGAIRIHPICAELRKIATQHGLRIRPHSDAMDHRGLPLPLVSEEEKNLVLDDRTSDRATELVALQHRPRNTVEIVEEIIRIERVVTQIVEQAP